MLAWGVLPACSSEQVGDKSVVVEEQVSQRVSDALFVWTNANPSANDPSGSGKIETRDPGQFGKANAAGRATILGVKNVVLAGNGLPEDAQLAEEWTQEVAHLNRVVWELTPDGLPAGEGLRQNAQFYLLQEG